MFVRLLGVACAGVALAALAPHVALAAPGDPLVLERARFAHDRGLAPIKPLDGDPSRYIVSPRVSPDAQMVGTEGWNVTLLVHGSTVTSEILAVTKPGRPYDIFADTTLAVRAFTAPVAADIRSSAIVANDRRDPDITQTFRHGSRFAYRIVDDRRNGIHSIEAMPLSALGASMAAFGVTPAPIAAPASSAAIYAVGYSGRLAPVAQRVDGSFRAIPDDAPPPARVHVIFGNRTVATLPATVDRGQARIDVPAMLHLSGVDNALASATFNGTATRARRAPTAAERATVLGLAAARLSTSAPHLTVRALTALDLGRGLALAGTVNLRGSGAKRVDRRLFFIAERTAGTWAFSLANVQAVTVSEPLLEDTAEMLIDGLDLGNGTVGVVTRIIGFDASSYAIYTRSGAAWKQIFTGGGAAN